MASYTEKFDAAVSVIKNLPKNGPFQPSYEMMKRFYGLFKQATEGPCTYSKPAFWNVVQTHKWQAWSSLGEMESEHAKELYVEELLKIIETMPQTDDVVSFLKVMGPFFELVTEKEAAEEEQMMTSTPKVTKVNGHMNGEVMMRENGFNERGDHTKALMNGSDSGIVGMPNGHLENGFEMIGGAGDEEGVRNGPASRMESDGSKDGAGAVETEEETRKKRLVLVESSRQGEDSAELSHPILISKSQLEAGEEHLSTSSESDSDTDEFCDSVDEPLTTRMDHTPRMDSLPSISEDGREAYLTSTPFNTENAVVTEAQVHNNMDAIIVPHYTTSSSSAPPRPAPSRRGGGEVTDGSKGQQGQGSSRQSGQGMPSGMGSGSHQVRQSHGSMDRVDGGGGMGGGGGGGAGGRMPGGSGSPLRSPIPGDVVEQITLSLERLQRDMNSVLVRLNTLETIAISRHQVETQQAYMREGVLPPTGQGVGLPLRAQPRSVPWWWPFSTLPVRTVFILLVWPFVVQWIMRFLARHRRARPPPR